MINKAIKLEYFDKVFKKYFEACKESDWLNIYERYKFEFAEWIDGRLHLEWQTDSEILAIIEESQQQQFDFNRKEKGLNFIMSSAWRGNGKIASIEEIKLMRQLINGDFPLKEFSLKDYDITYPKFSVWISCLDPQNYAPYPGEEVLEGINYLLLSEKKSKIPSRGKSCFIAATAALINIRELLKEHSNALSALFKEFRGANQLNDLFYNWIAQDLCLFIARRLLPQEQNKETESGVEYVNDDLAHKYTSLQTQNNLETNLHFSSLPNGSPIALNTIYYGPPGTGKTYFLVKTYFKKHKNVLAENAVVLEENKQF